MKRCTVHVVVPGRRARAPRATLALLVALVACASEPQKNEPPDGWKAYEKGNFEQAQAEFQKAGDQHGLGRLKLQNFDFVGARQHLLHATTNEAKNDLALSYLLEGDFANAAELFAALKQDEYVKLLNAFTKPPYQIDQPRETVLIPLAATDPLPILEVSVNGEGPYYFFIDTGAAEIFVDKKVCRRHDIRILGKQTGTFAGGVAATIEMAKIDSLQIGEVTIRDLPASVMDIEGFSNLLKHPVHGIIGTHVLMRFLSTIDYKNGRLILSRKTAPPPQGVNIPFVLVGDHFILARGKLNHYPLMWFVDTGLVGAGLTATIDAIKNAGITVKEAPQSGQGGGGRLTITPFKVSSVSLGDLRRENMLGFAGAFPQNLERRYRVRIEGILSHLFFRPGSLTFDFNRMMLIYRE
jgi:predicted aspartyl protease